jgi:hypothetical protein
MSGTGKPQARGASASGLKPASDNDDDDIENEPLPTIIVPAWMASQQRWMLACDEGSVGRDGFVADHPHDPNEWATLAGIDVVAAADAVSNVARTPWLGRLFCLGPISRLNAKGEEIGEIVIGLVLTGCIGDDGAIADWATPYVATMGSYAEFTEDRRGIQCIARLPVVELADARKRLGIAADDPTQSRTRSYANGGHAASAQLFIGAHSLTITGNHWKSSPPDEVNVLYAGQLSRLGVEFTRPDVADEPEQGTPPKPNVPPPPDLTGTPLAFLTAPMHRRWVGWRFELVGEPGKRKWSKIPYQIGSSRKARSNDPTTWCDFDTALQSVRRHVHDGVGLVLQGLPGELFGAVDLDDVRDPATGVLLPWAQKLVDECGSYVEVTPSGCGIRLLGSAEAITTIHTRITHPHGGAFELFVNCARYITATGNVITTGWADISGIIERLAELRPPPEARGGNEQSAGAIQLDKLNPVIIGLITNATVLGKTVEHRGQQFLHVVRYLKKAGYSYADSLALLQAHPKGVAGKYAGRLEREFRRAWDKSRPPDADDKAPWPEPVDCFTAYDTTPVDVTADEAPPPLWDFVEDTAERMGAATSSVALNAIVSCAAVISEEWEVQPKAFDDLWTENARLWGATVGPPSIMKTPVLKACTQPVDYLEMKARKEWQGEFERWKRKHAEWKRSDQSEPEPQRPREPRYIVESTTVEALHEVLRTDESAHFTAPAGKLLSRQDELGEFLANLDRYHAGRSGGDRGAYLRLYTGGSYRVDRIIRGSTVLLSWSACLLGGIQPEPIQRFAKDSVDDGLLQRFIYDVPSPHPMTGMDRRPNYPAIERYRRLFPVLAALHPAKTDEGHIQAVALHADAHTSRERIEDLRKSIIAMPDTTKRLQSALGKWDGLFARLCLTFHLIEVADAHAQGDLGPPVSAISAATAARVERYMRNVLLPHLLRAYELMFRTVQTDHARWIAGHIIAHELDRITARDVVRAYIQLRAPEDRLVLDATMAGLVTIGWLDPEKPRNPLNPVSAWRVNPMAHERFAARKEQEQAERQQRAEETVRRRKAELGERSATSTTSPGRDCQ